MTEKPDAPKPATDEDVEVYKHAMEYFQRYQDLAALELLAKKAEIILARIDQDRDTIASERARADKAEQEVERLTLALSNMDNVIDAMQGKDCAQLSEARAEIARLREALLECVNTHDAIVGGLGKSDPPAIRKARAALANKGADNG